jgi:hypothetical protein
VGDFPGRIGVWASGAGLAIRLRGAGICRLGTDRQVRFRSGRRRCPLLVVLRNRTRCHAVVPARIYDCLLRGKHQFEADAAAAGPILTVVPEIGPPSSPQHALRQHRHDTDPGQLCGFGFLFVSTSDNRPAAICLPDSTVVTSGHRNSVLPFSSFSVPISRQFNSSANLIANSASKVMSTSKAHIILNFQSASLGWRLT